MPKITPTRDLLVPPGLSDFVSGLKTLLRQLFELAHDHPLRRVIPAANEGMNGDILSVAEPEGDFCLYSKFVEGWKRFRSAEDVVEETVAGLVASRAVATNASVALVSSDTTSTELSYVHGVTSGIQGQLDAKEPTLAKGNLTEATSSVLTIGNGTNAVIGAGTTIQVTQADATHDGFLDSGDWVTFNAKEPAVTKGNLTETTSSILTISGGTGAVIGAGTTIAVQAATDSVPGYMTAADHTALTGTISTANAALPSASFTDAAVTGKLLTGFSSGAGTVAGTDTILQGINKLDGNVVATTSVANAALPAASFTDTAVTGKLLTGYSSGAGTVAATDTILEGINKLNGNAANIKSTADAALPSASFTDAAVTGKLITGFVQGAGTVAATDTILQAINKLDGNVAGKEPTLSKGNLSETTSAVLTVTGGTNAVIGSGTTIEVKVAGAGQSGYLTSTDWSTFNGKQDALGYTAENTANKVTSFQVTPDDTHYASEKLVKDSLDAKEPTLAKGNLTESTSSVLTIGSGTGAVIGSGTTIQVKQAGAGQDGYLSSTDWNTFNNKGSGSGTVNSGTANMLAYYPASSAAVSAVTANDLYYDASNHRVGVGTVPDVTLHAHTVASATPLKVSGGDANAVQIILTHSGGGTGNEFSLGVTDDSHPWGEGFYLYDSPAATARLFINGSGNVGIGTTSPSSKLSINGGLHVGGDSDPGDNNLLVDGTIKVGAGALQVYSAYSMFESTGNTITANSVVQVAHGFADTPHIVKAILRCTSAHANYAAGDEVVLESAVVARACSIFANTTYVGVAFSGLPSVTDKSTFADTTIDASKWFLTLRAWY